METNIETKTKPEAIIKTKGVTKIYGTKAVVNKVNMTIYKGDIYGFIGSNGAGKSTFIRCIMGLIKYDGKIEILGRSDPMGLLQARTKIGAIVENPALASNLNGWDCLKAHALLYGVRDDDKMTKLLELVGLQNTGTKKVKDFSLGMRQRMAIAQALINDPEILILDEPTNGMDPQGIVEMRKFLQMLCKTKGITILVSSHILAELQQLATRIGIINDGKLIDEFAIGEIANKMSATVTISTSDAAKAVKLLKDFEVTQKDDGSIVVKDEDFKAINKLLAKNDIDVDVVSKSQGSLESYFMGKVVEE